MDVAGGGGDGEAGDPDELASSCSLDSVGERDSIEAESSMGRVIAAPLSYRRRSCGCAPVSSSYVILGRKAAEGVDAT